MSKYDKLIQELRSCRDKAVFSDYWWDITWRAANAIEELTDSLERYQTALSHEQKINVERSEFYRNLSISHTQENQAALLSTLAIIPAEEKRT